MTSQSLQRCELCKRPFTKGRSGQQNKYYWSQVVGLISEVTGYTTDETHEIIKSKFLKSFKEYKGKMYEYTMSTTVLTTTEWESLMSQVRSWASMEFGCFIPQPNEITDETHKTWFN